jgi:Adenylate cyclase, family 3 (some proteins contain HAMP domain)
MEPAVHYVTTADGVRIAYSMTGEGPPVLSCPETLTSHVQLEWSRPVIGPLLREFARRNTLIRFDPRGSGLSDRVLAQTLDEFVLDIEAVVERAGFREFPLIASQLGTPAAIVFAARHPEQVTRFAIIDGFARIADVLDTPQARTLVAAAQSDWVMATEAIGFMVFGAGRDESRDWGSYIRSCVGPESFAPEYLQVVAAFDASDLAQLIRAPTLIVRHNGLRFVTMEMVKDLAVRIPNAQLAIVEGTWADDLEGYARRITDFINAGVVQATPPPELPSGMTAILFADIADSTALTERLGDAAFRAKARELDGALRGVIRDNAGTPIEGKLLGDGVLAVFTSARQAIEAALLCGRSGDEAGLPLHLGIHAGDVIREDNNVYGGAVNIASRISGLSAPGELLVSRTVADLARTSSGVTFEDRGEHELKGVAEPQHVFAVRKGAS